MNDDQFCDELAARFAPPHAQLYAAAGASAAPNMQGRLADVLKKLLAELRAKGLSVNWWSLIALIPQIIALIQGGGSIQAIIAAIIAILFPPQPAPATP